MCDCKSRNFSDEQWQEWEEATRAWLGDANESRKETFFRDGIICENTFADSGFRPLFILKEVYDKNGCTCNDTERANCIKEKIREDFTPGEPRHVDMCKCIHGFNSNEGLWKKVAELEAVLEDVYKAQKGDRLNNAAVINLKKLAGGGTADSEKSLGSFCYSCHAVRFNDLLRRQIEAIRPGIIICCGSFDIKQYNRKERNYNFLGYKFVKNSEDYSEKGEFEVRGRKVTLSICDYVTTEFTYKPKVHLLDINHPSYISDADWAKYLEFFEKVAGKVRCAQ